MFIFLLVIHIFVCLILIAVILLQAGKGGGLAETFGGGSAQAIFGTRASTFLTRATTASAVIFLLTSLGLAIISSRRGRSLMELEAARERARQVIPLKEVVPVEEVVPGEEAKEVAPTAEEVLPAEEVAAPERQRPVEEEGPIAGERIAPVEKGVEEVIPIEQEK